MPSVSVAFDVGIVHLAFVVIESIEESEWATCPLPVKILMTETIDLTRLKHERVPRDRCQLHHTAQIADRMAHFFAEYEPRFREFGEISRVYLEQQPITGITSVESLLFQRYRECVKLVSPTQMHRWAGIHLLDYDRRKEAVVEMAREALEPFPSFRDLERQHDQADALMILLFELYQEQLMRATVERRTEREQWFRDSQDQTIDEFYEQFRYKGNGVY